ncbi:MAG: entericidin A/B family lipoprotein [Phycisphaeraceae bacterium]
MRKRIEFNGLMTWLSRTMLVMAAGVLSVTMAAGMAGCETTEGVGRDVEAVGEGVQRGADEADPGSPEQW